MTRDAPPRSTAGADELQARPTCVGRFAFDVPAGWIVTHRLSAIYQVELETIRPPGDGIKGSWPDLMRELREKVPPRGAASAIVKEFELAAGVPAAWYHTTSANAEAITLVAQRRFGDHELRVRRHSTTGAEALTQRLLGDVLAAYRPGEAVAYCIGNGSVVSEPGVNEEAALELRWSEDPEVIAKITTRARQRPDSAHPLAKLDPAPSAPRSLSPAVPQVAAGLQGESRSVQFTDGPATFLMAVWYFPGLPGDAIHPEARIDVLGPAKKMSAVKAAFQTIVGSLRPLPRQP